MRNAGEPKCCLDCGRWGNRGYRRDDVREGWVCSNDRACGRRVNEARRGWVSLGCTFCHFQRKDYHTPERETREEARADWNAHVLAEHDDLQWTEDHRAELQPAGHERGSSRG